MSEPDSAALIASDEVAADLLRLADKIENEHRPARFCECCSTDAGYLRDLAARYARKAGGEHV